MKQLWGIIDFIRAAKTRLRYGELSRAPLQLLRVQWEGKSMEIDWLARSPDVWDSALSERLRDCNASVQALEDAMAVRELLLGSLPQVQNAELRVFRRQGGGVPEMIIAGTVSRDSEPSGSVVSLAMRAKLSGLRFRLDEGVLGTLQEETLAISNL